MPLQIGDMLNHHYLINTILRSDEIVLTYRAVDTLGAFNEKRVCRVKEFQLGGRRDATQQFLQEARLLLNLDHPNLPKVEELFESGGNYYLAMSEMDGRSLAEMMDERGGEPFPEKQVIGWMDQLLDAVGYCHAQGTAFRGINPANVVISTNGDAYWVDSGIAEPIWSTQNTTAGETKTSAFTPPKQHVQDYFLDDIYSLGAILYTLLTGRGTTSAIERDQAGELLIPWQLGYAISTNVEMIIRKAMSINPDDRFRSVEEMRMALVQLAVEVSVAKIGSEPQSKASIITQETDVRTLPKQEETRAIPIKEKESVKQEPIPVEDHSPIDNEPDKKVSHQRSKTSLRLPLLILKKAIVPMEFLILIGVIVAGAMVLSQKINANHLRASTTLTSIALESIHISQTLTAAPTSTATFTFTYTITPNVTSTPTFTLSPTMTLTPTFTSTFTITPTITMTPTSTSTSTLTPIPRLGSTQVSPVDKMVMVYVPEGNFWMGSDIGEANAKPMHQVWLDAYWIDRTEITNAKYAKCVQGGGCSVPRHVDTSSWGPYYGNPKFDDFPVVFIVWNDAVAYCAWAKRRLPSEAEWEKAARGTDQRTYPWGNTYNSKYSNSGQIHYSTMQVGSFSEYPSPYGAYDMAGNVWEWVMDWYDVYSGILATRTNPAGPNSGTDHIVRGGSWSSIENYYIKTYARSNQSGDSTSELVGFRCAESRIP